MERIARALEVSSLTDNKEKRVEGGADQLKGVDSSTKGHVKNLFRFP